MLTWVYVGVGLAVFYLVFLVALCGAAGRWDKEHRR